MSLRRCLLFGVAAVMATEPALAQQLRAPGRAPYRPHKEECRGVKEWLEDLEAERDEEKGRTRETVTVPRAVLYGDIRSGSSKHEGVGLGITLGVEPPAQLRRPG